MWNSFEIKSDVFVCLTEDNIQTKIDALKAYKSQGFRIYTSEDSIRVMAKYKGLQVKQNFVESFEMIRLILK